MGCLSDIAPWKDSLEFSPELVFRAPWKIDTNWMEFLVRHLWSDVIDKVILTHSKLGVYRIYEQL